MPVTSKEVTGIYFNGCGLLWDGPKKTSIESNKVLFSLVV